MKTFALLLAGLVLAGSASAQAVKPNSGIYVGVEGGLAQFGKADAEPGYRITSANEKPGYLRGALGYQFTPNWAMEGGYFQTGDGKMSSTNGFASNEYKVNVKGVDLAALYKSTDVLPGLFFKAGVTLATASLNYVQRSAVKRSEDNMSQSGMGYLAGVGYEYDISTSVSASVGYTRLQRVSGSDSGINLYNAGLKYRF